MRLVHARRVGIELHRLVEVAQRRSRIVCRKVRMPSQHIKLDVARVIGDGAAQIFRRLVVSLEEQFGLGPRAVSWSEASIKSYGTIEIAQRRMRSVLRQMKPAASVERCGSSRAQLHGLRKVPDGGI